jgi:kynurenine formamidase
VGPQQRRIVEQVTATQQMETHLDALNHLQDGDRTYNGHRLADIAEEYGTNTLGVDTHLNTRHGVVVVENRRLRDLAAAGVHEFMLVISHAKLRGATGAWVAPLAIV